MLNEFEDVLLVIVIVLLSLGSMLVLNKVWPREKRKVHNDLIGWQLGILGTTYAVILGFMLYTVWTDFGAASANANVEASQIVKLHRLAAGLPAEQREQMRALSLAYADAVLNREWAEMADGKIGMESSEISRKMWHVLMSIQSPTWTQITSEDHALYELSTLVQSRETRELEVTSKLPGVLWFVLVIGGVLTIFSACLFGQDSTLLHGIQVFSFSLLIALALVAIADIDRPFMGTVHVSDAAFRRALLNIQPEKQAPVSNENPR
jgi:lipid-A-disaccharide synthase-like uncharacterized protein